MRWKLPLLQLQWLQTLARVGLSPTCLPGSECFSLALLGRLLLALCMARISLTSLQQNAPANQAAGTVTFIAAVMRSCSDLKESLGLQ